ncbi:MAG TPA: pilus assembly protein N-terminal domain-containing protein [Dongiaceae bacterium]|nr:pilus assembly protein N-terminal domain-containing protein [Dongiaceae bacterium]
MMNKSFMRAFLLLCAISAAIPVYTSRARADGILSIPLNSAEIIRLQGNPKDIIIANPNVADVTLQTPDHMIIIGKQPGRTSLLILDPEQKIILKRMVVVSDGNDGLVIVHGPRGGTMSQDSYACAQNCTMIPGSNIGGSTGGGIFSAPAPDTSSQDTTPGPVTQVQSKIKMKVSPNGEVTGTRTDVPVYGTPPQ